MSTYTSILDGQLVWPAYSFGQTIALISNLTLSWPNQFQDANLVVTNIMNVTPDAGGRTLRMPDATQTSNFISTLVVNTGGFTFTLIDNSGGTIIACTAGSTNFVYLDDNTTVAGNWRTNPSGGGYVAVTSVAAVTAGSAAINNIGIAGSPITTTGTFTFTLLNDLLALSSFAASTGIVARTASNAFTLRNLTGTAGQIVVTNGAGIAGNPTFALATAITGINSILVGNLSLASNTISSINMNGNIILDANGTGNIQLSNETRILDGSDFRFYTPGNSHYIGFSAGVSSVDVDLTWPTVAPVGGQVLSYTGGTSLGWANVTTFGGPSTINAFPRYSNITGSLKDSIILADDSGNITGSASILVGQIGIGTLDPQTITTTAANENLKLSPNGSGQVSGPSGIISAPGYTFTGKTTNGMWSSAANTIDFSTNAFRALQLVASPASSANYLTLTSDVAANPVIIGATGAGADVGIKFSLKGAGNLQNVDGTQAKPAYSFASETNSGMYLLTTHVLGISINNFPILTFNNAGNVGLSTGNTFNAVGVNVFAISSGTPPNAGLTDALQIYCDDISAGNTSLCWYGEGTGGVSVVSPTSPNRTIAIKVNGTIFYIAAKTTND